VRQRRVAIAFLLASAGYLALSLGFPFGSLARPGAGFFPVAVGAFLCAAALTVVVTGFGGATLAGPTLERDARGRVLVTALALVGFCLLVPWLGYPICAALFVALLLRRLGGTPWPGAVATAVLSAATSYYVFAVLLAVPLPRGVWLD
jgi:putative tricarboxylic transport membrane protein